MNLNTRIIAALILIGVGLLSLMSMSVMWPLIILLPGLVMLGIALRGGPAGAAAMSIPGMFVTGLGGLLFIQNWTGYWESWAYAWTLLGVFVGMGFMLMGQGLHNRQLHTMGNFFVRSSMVMFAAFAVFFELIIGINGGGGTLGALIMVGLGLLLLSRGCKFHGDGKTKHTLGKAKRTKTKRDDDYLFTGPVVYGTRANARRADRLILVEDVHASEHDAH